ncbi:MAG: FAD-dependent oxidoreductase, partial [Erysipelotrichaceae bacterium]|nr:FAD-dependent oxidoreductase [Erysipelotrichaceae bacterium]
KVSWLTTALKKEADRAGAKFKFNTEATPELLKKDGIKAVFYAGGAPQLKPELPGINQKNVGMAVDVIDGKYDVEGEVVIIGSGLTGLETAEMVINSGKATKVTVVDMVPVIGATMFPSVFVDIMRQFAGKDVTLLAGHRLDSIDGNAVSVTKVDDGTSVQLKADHVLLAMGQKIDTKPIREFEDAFDRVVIIGESRKAPGRIATSLADGYIEALGFDPVA